MTTEVQKQLMSFYFGAVSDQDRLQIEQQLLLDPEVLVTYLDLKRAFENAQAVPEMPSPQVWVHLQSHFKKSKTTWIWSFALSTAAVLIIAVLINWDSTQPVHQDQQLEPNRTHIIFDSSRELPASSNVL